MSKDDTPREEFGDVTEDIDLDGDFSVYNLPKTGLLGWNDR
jgi:hypothetical protein